MKRILKILFGLIALIVVLLVLAGFLLPIIYDEEDLKQTIATQFHEQTGRKVAINGDLEFTVFPWLAVKVTDLSVNNAEGFADEEFASIKEARVGVALMPLFSKKIVVDEITLDGLNLVLVVNKRGRSNWEDFTNASPEEGQSANEKSIFTSQEVAGLDIFDANISYKDLQAGVEYRLSGFNMQTGALGTGDPLPVEVRTLLEDVAAGSKYDISLTTNAAIDFEAKHFRLNDLDLELADPSKSDAAPIRIRTPAMSADLETQTLAIESFSADLSDLKLSGTLNATNILGDPAFSGTLTSEEFSISTVMKGLAIEPPVTADPNALQRASFSADFSGNADRIELKPLTLKLDQSTIDGVLSLGLGNIPQLRFDLNVDTLDIDRYLAPATAETEEDVAIPSDEIRDIDVDGMLRIGAMTLAGMAFSEAQLGVRVLGGKLRLHPLTATFYGGTYKGDVRLDSAGAVPVMSLDEKLDAVIFQQLIGDLVDEESLSGTALGHIQLTGHGSTSTQVLKSLNGDVGLTLTEGALEGINIWYEIRRAYSLYKGLPAPEPEPKRTVFSKMQFAASVSDGVVNTRELVGELPFLTVRGEGAIDLGRSEVDLGLVAAVRDMPELNKEPLTADLGGKQFPFKISGPLDDPVVAVDWGEFLKGEAVNLLLDKLVPQSGEEEAGADGEREEQSTEKKVVDSLFKMLKSSDKDKPDDAEEG